MILAGGTDSEKIDLLELGLTKIFGAKKGSIPTPGLRMGPSRWKRVRTNGSFLDHFGIILDYFGDHSWIILGSFLDHSGSFLNRAWVPSGRRVGSIRALGTNVFTIIYHFIYNITVL